MAVVTAALFGPDDRDEAGEQPAADNPPTTKEGWRAFVDDGGDSSSAAVG